MRTGDYTGQLFGNYQLVKLLGSGGFAEVYEGEHIYLQTRAAIKILHTRLAENQRAGFLNEAQTIARLQHEHIVRVLEFDVQEETPFLVMEYAPGGTLRERFPKGKAAPLEQVLPVVQQVASALHYAHEQRLVHRDVKPENMLLGQENEVLLSDFGIALLLQSTHGSGANEVVGTVSYMAPEQLRGQAQPASDQYALAIAVYEWLCGERPFQGTSFASIASQHLLNTPPALKEKAPHLPLAITEVVHKALAKDPQQRFASVHDFALAFSETADSDSIPTSNNSATPEPSPVTTTPDTARREVTQTPLSERATPINATQPATSQPVSTVTQLVPPARRTMTTRKIILFAMLALLLAVGGTIAHFTFSSTSTPPATPKNSSPTPQKRSAQYYQHLYLQATSGQPDIDDPLNVPDSLDWSGQCRFSGGTLHVQPAGGCIAINFSASDYAYQVEMTINAGKIVKNKVPDGMLWFRFNKTGTYFFDVTIDGLCGLGVEKSTTIPYLLPPHPCSAVHTGYHQTNLLTAIAQGSSIYLYINKQFVGTINDDTYSAGLVGVFAQRTTIDTEFKNARIWILNNKEGNK